MNVEIWSDVVCPWCYIGERRFEAALAEFEHRDAVTITWRSFELDPSAPREHEGDNASRLAAKYGMSREEALERRRHMTELAAADGLEMDFARSRGGNTFDAHRLLHLAAAHGRQDAIKERFMRAYHSEGEPIGDPATLERLAVEGGLDAAEVRELLAGDRYAAEVREDERIAAALGINAVPFFVVDRAYGAAGAQPPEALRDLLERAFEAEPESMRSAAAPPSGG